MWRHGSFARSLPGDSEYYCTEAVVVGVVGGTGPVICHSRRRAVSGHALWRAQVEPGRARVCHAPHLYMSFISGCKALHAFLFAEASGGASSARDPHCAICAQLQALVCLPQTSYRGWLASVLPALHLPTSSKTRTAPHRSLNPGSASLYSSSS